MAKNKKEGLHPNVIYAIEHLRKGGYIKGWTPKIKRVMDSVHNPQLNIEMKHFRILSDNGFLEPKGNVFILREGIDVNKKLIELRKSSLG